MEGSLPQSDARVALITGAGRGIGLAIARRLASDGVAVCIADLDLEPAQAAASLIESEGGQALALAGDVARLEACVGWAEAAVERFGNLHILVNNAGLTRDAMVHRMSDEQWQLVQDVVLGGAFNTVRAVAPWFRDRERRAPRRIVNVASVSGIYGSPGNVNYSAAKAGVIGLTRTIAAEWARFGVTVNAVAPGFITTRMTAARTGERELGMPPDVRDAIIARIPVGRAGEPEDVAAAVAYFCSPDAGFVTGQVLEIHGGLPDITVTG
jgi:3-oxoacyl-[acyl-carrier protein] reductase